ncbi:hypothetical protein EUZ85_00945 [Hahella sp. KA22]|uniref:hypothetical protein n=1 Tax=Hahella sp. KA22 TaxID=1628392 RepID=UPI000FDF2D4C|nr:hypothetical protein [Hahella sp. KA22]AZZ95062.1 hypothetical protein ENC22_29235 [Hahella sp. KA22]QAY52707.1 hypothetical protein EUZ85_00945 [Hahella sp. KA22]
MGAANMTNSLFVDSTESKVRRYFPDSKLAQLYLALDATDEFYGAGVTFIALRPVTFVVGGDPLNPPPLFDVRVLRQSCRADGKTVYIREVQLPPKASKEEVVATAKSSLGKELTNAGLSCAGAAIGWILVVGEAGGGTVSAGAAWAAMPLTMAATSAATFQCGVAIGRTTNVVRGNAHYNEWLDESPEFGALMIALDVIQIADVAKTLGNQAILYRFLSNKGIGSGNLLKMYQQLSRASRKRLAEELLKFEHPELLKSRKLLKEILSGARMLDDGSKAVKVYTQTQVQILMRTKFLELLGSAITVNGSSAGAMTAAQGGIGFIIGFGQK